MVILSTFLNEDATRIIQYLLSNTQLAVRLGSGQSTSFVTTIGTPQGDSLSPILFVIYLEAALRDVRQRLPGSNQPANHLPFDLEYADDVDFVNSSSQWLHSIEPEVADILGEWYLTVNQTKTEYTEARRDIDRSNEGWRMVKKLGSLLGDAEDVTRRKQLAAVAFKSLWQLWRRNCVSLQLKVRLYNAFVLPVLLYNCGTWGLTQQSVQSLEAFHRRQLRSLMGIRWPNRLPNVHLYEQCKASPVGLALIRARWRLLGHTLRLDNTTPAHSAMVEYFRVQGIQAYRGRPRITLPVALGKDLARVDKRLATLNDLNDLTRIAGERAEWSNLCRAVVEAYLNESRDTDDGEE